ncbi:MAG: recombinase RecA [Candidatus Zixiibacteriota bacterium]
MATDDKKQKALKLAVDQIQKDFGSGSIMRLGDKGVDLSIPTISTGCISLDTVLGIGGIPRGRITEIFGPESSGKTTLALHCIAEAQKTGGFAAFIDAEHALDPKYARQIGVDTDNLWVAQPDYGEQALDIAEQLVRSMAVDIIVIDSVAALVPKSEIEGEMGDQSVGLQARLMSRALRKLAAIVNKTRTSLVFINQTRMKIGVMFGSPETTSGGTALKFYSSVRMRIARTGSIKVKGENMGNTTKVKIVKNKVAPPFREAQFDIIFGEGISKLGEILDLASDMNVIQKRGAYYKMGDDTIGQGKENAKEFLKENPKVAADLEKQIRDKLGLVKDNGDKKEEKKEKKK